MQAETKYEAVMTRTHITLNEIRDLLFETGALEGEARHHHIMTFSVAHPQQPEVGKTTVLIEMVQVGKQILTEKGEL